MHSWDGDLTYAELDGLSDRLARQLVSFLDATRPEHGGGNGSSSTNTLIPLCFEKSMYAVISVLAVMKSGIGFVFLSPAQPIERLRSILSEVAGSIIISSPAQADLVREITTESMRHLVVSESSLSSFGNDGVIADEAPLPPSPPPASTLYAIFTSGSTGTPKGVLVSHENYTSGAIQRAEAVGYSPRSRVLDFAAYVFDVSIDCMLCTLSRGGCICIPSEEDRMNSLGSVITRLGVNMAHMTPSVARLLDPEVMSSLDVLGLGGEAVSAKDAQVWNKTTKIVVAYGPSECTVGCTVNNDVSGDAEAGMPYASIGKGIGGATWVVSPYDHNQLMPVGAVGELLVEGPIVGKGYLNRPDLTEKVFIEDPDWLLTGHVDVPGRRGRLYMTGDLVSYSLDGSGRLFFVSRKDQQVKIRGQRVELAEIEHHLLENLPERTSVAAEVIKPGGASSEPMLVVFIAEYGESTLETAEGSCEASFGPQFKKALSRAHDILSRKLPSYMMPSSYIPLSKMPILVSCKTDRKRLRDIGSSMSRSQLAKLRQPGSKRGSGSPPTTEKERMLNRLWSEVIGRSVDAGRDDNFFLLGGDSLKAMRLVSVARKEGIILSVGSVFANPSLSAMASAAVTEKPEHQAAEIYPFSLIPTQWNTESLKSEVATLCNLSSPGEVEDIYPCTPLQEGLMALSAKIRGAYTAQRVVRLKDQSMAYRMREAFEITSADSPILRTRIVQVSFKGLLQVVTNGSIPWRSGADLKQYLKDDRSEPMGLGTPLVRYAIITDSMTGANDFVLTIHHALYDGWSMDLLVCRINQSYRGIRAPKATPFTAFISHLGSQRHEASENYWIKHLAGATGPQFPSHPYKGYQVQPDSLLERYIPIPKESATASGTTLATVVRAAWAFLFARELSITDVVLGETLTGRNSPIPGVEGIEGPMITTVPMRIQIHKELPIDHILRDIHQQTIERIPHENFGLQNIRRLTLDAREACDLKTGLVLHPAAEKSFHTSNHVEEDERANAFVPADDVEAAREALKFNTYALMLVCSLETDGFLVMASFDSRTVEMWQMERLLKELERLVGIFYSSPGTVLKTVDFVDDEDVSTVWRFSTGASFPGGVCLDLGISEDATIDSAWVVDPDNAERLLPVGAVGEILVECCQHLSLNYTSTPQWLEAGHGDYAGRWSQFYKTGKVGRYSNDGNLTILRSLKSWCRRESAKQLPQAAGKATIPEGSNRPDSTTLKRLLPLWARAVFLPEEDIDPDDSFFSLGGDSIGAMKLVSEAGHLGLELTVADVFKHKTLSSLVTAVQKTPINTDTVSNRPESPEQSPRMTDSGYVSPIARESPLLPPKPFTALISSMLHNLVRPQLDCGPDTEIADVLPTRPLQDIAIAGTIQNPKFSVRYEMVHLPIACDQYIMARACQALVEHNEILRTVFVAHGTDYLAVVLRHVDVPIHTFELSPGTEPAEFARSWSNLDVLTVQNLGAPFVKFALVSSPTKSSLVLRISHAQYDEMCLPSLIAQLGALYSTGKALDPIPYSAFIASAINQIPNSFSYWRSLLHGSQWTSLSWPRHPPSELHGHYAVEKTIPVAKPPAVTLATLPVAAWAITLARITGRSDVLFGEVVSGRSCAGLNGAEKVIGPTWQYVPVRLELTDGMTAGELLDLIQHQHVESAPHGCVSLREMVREGLVKRWVPPWEEEDGHNDKCGVAEEGEPWFPTVVHQAVASAGQV